MSFTEKNFQTIFGKQNKIKGVFELKLSKLKSISFDSVKEHQIKALLKVQEDGLYHKITDQPWIKDRPHTFTLKKPFDCFFIKDYPAYIVIMFYELKTKKNVYYVTVNNWLFAQEKSEKKSITEKELQKIASYEFNYMGK